MQHPVAVEGAHRTVFHLDEETHRNRPLGHLEELDEPALEPGEMRPRPVELLVDDAQRVELLRGVCFRIYHAPPGRRAALLASFAPASSASISETPASVSISATLPISFM